MGRQKRMKKLVLLKKYSYAGKHLKPGDIFDAKDADVRLLKALKVAADYVPPPEPKKTWRDVAAIAPAVEPVVRVEDPYTFSADTLAGSPAQTVEPTKEKRRYLRRDMKAE
jgi:hypothetical protein